MRDQKIEDLKSRNPIFEVARRLDLRIPSKEGGTVATNCIFHSPDKHPSLVLMSDVNRFECKTCGVKGDAIDLVCKVKGIDFKSAVLWLDPNFSSEKNYENPELYLRISRGITLETQEKFGLRCEAKRIVIPLRNGEKYRWLGGEKRFSHKKETKAELFKTSEANDFVILGEGELDAILTWQTTGYPVWTGTAGVDTLKDEWLSEFKDIKKIYIAFDADKAGDKFAFIHAEKLGIDRCLRLRPSAGKDWTEFFVDYKKTKEDFNQLLKNALPVTKVQPSDASWPKPLLERAFYGLAGEFVKTIEPHSEADPVAVLVNFLTAFGSIIGDKAHIRLGPTSHPMRLFTILVGKTSKARKGASWGYPKEVFGKLDEVWKNNLSSGASTGEGLIYHVRDKTYKSEPIKKNKEIIGYRDVIDDKGIEDKRLLLVEEEFATILRRLNGWEGNTLSAIIRNAWDTGDLKTLTKNSPLRATSAHISIIGHITKDELIRYLTFTETANGFGNRFLWFCVKRSKNLPFGGELSDSELELLTNKIRLTVDFAKQATEINWSDETKQLWELIYPTLSEGLPGMIGAMTSRAEAYVVRLACIYTLLDKTTVIKPQHLLAAIAVWDYAENSVRYIFQDKLGDPIAEKVIEALLTTAGGMSRTDINNLFGRNVESERISSALKILENYGRAKSQISFTSGRNEERWFAVNKEHNSFLSFNSYLGILEKYIKEHNLIISSTSSKDYEENEFNEKSEQEIIPFIVGEDLSSEAKPTKCSVCGGSEFWERPNHGGWVCSTCHPPTFDNGVSERVETEEAK